MDDRTLGAALAEVVFELLRLSTERWIAGDVSTAERIARGAWQLVDEARGAHP